MKMGVGKRTMTLFRPLFSKKKVLLHKNRTFETPEIAVHGTQKKRGGEKGSWGQKRKEVKKV